MIKLKFDFDEKIYYKEKEKIIIYKNLTVKND